MSRVTIVSFLWSLLSLLVAGACAFSFYHPSWVAHPDRLHSFGLFTQCVRDPGSSYPRPACHGYGPGGRVDLGSVPAGAWQASSLLYGAGMGLQGLGALVSLALLLLLPAHPYSGRRVALLCGYVQTLADRQTVVQERSMRPTVTRCATQPDDPAHVSMESSDYS